MSMIAELNMTDTENMNAIPSFDDGGAHVIVFGNEKGGSGKSTSAMHAAIALLRLGYKVGSIDLDARQGTFTRYLKNRWDNVIRNHTETPSPLHMAIERSQAETVEGQKKEERDFLMMALDELRPCCDFVVIDTPGTDSYLSRLAHSCADTLITPLNDSFIDLDLLAHIDPVTHEIIKPSIYSHMVKEQQEIKQSGSNGKTTHWIVMRNRLSHIDAKNREMVGQCLETLSKELDFTLVTGFGERVIFKELFLQGLTLLDLKENREKPLTLSEISARQEVRHLINAISPETIKGYIKPPKNNSGASVQKAND